MPILCCTFTAYPEYFMFISPERTIFTVIIVAIISHCLSVYNKTHILEAIIKKGSSKHVISNNQRETNIMPFLVL